MQSVALGKRKILLEAWQTHFIRDLVTSSKMRTLHQVSLKQQDLAAWLGYLIPIHSVCLILCILHHISLMVKRSLLKNMLKEM